MEAATRAMDAGSDALPATVRVWDPFVRIFHWSLVALFAFAFLTGDEWDKPHEFAGYVVAGLIGLRVIWGFIGTRHARFSDFVTGPGTVIGYLKDAAGFRARRHLGDPVTRGGYALLASSAITSVLGLAYWVAAARLFDKAVGYATLTLDRASGYVTLSVWPYLSGPQRSTPDDKPYPGWPITIDPATQKRID